MRSPLHLASLAAVAALAWAGQPPRARADQAATGDGGPKHEWTVTLAEDTPVEGVELPAGTVLHYQAGDWPPPTRGPDGKPVPFVGPPAPVLVRAVPSTDLEAWGVTIAAGEDLFLGSFVSLVLDGEATVDGLPLEAGTVLEFERERGVNDDQAFAIKVLRGCTLARAATVEGIQIPGGAALEFRPHGRLWLVRLFDDDELAGYPVSSAADAEFHRNGTLSRFRLSEDFALGGHTCQADEDVELHRSGHLASCLLAPGELVQGLAPDGDQPTRFFDTGLVESIALTQAATVDGLALEPGALLDFHDNGRLRRVRSGFAQDPERPKEKRFVTQVVRGIPLEPNLGDAAGDGAFFRRDGSLEKVVTRDDFTYEGIPVAGGPDPVEFWVSGRLKSARLATDLVKNGRTYRAGMPIRLRRDGSLAFVAIPRPPRELAHPEHGVAPSERPPPAHPERSRGADPHARPGSGAAAPRAAATAPGRKPTTFSRPPASRPTSSLARRISPPSSSGGRTSSAAMVASPPASGATTTAPAPAAKTVAAPPPAAAPRRSAPSAKSP